MYQQGEEEKVLYNTIAPDVSVQRSVVVHHSSVSDNIS